MAGILPGGWLPSLVGIEPLEGRHEKGNFQKTIVKYTNTVGYANQDGNLLVEESMLIRPAYRCYLLLSEEHPDHRKLYEYIREGWAEYIPYLGKNEYPAWFGDSSSGNMLLKLLYRKLIFGFHPCLSKKEY